MIKNFGENKQWKIENIMLWQTLIRIDYKYIIVQNTTS